MSGLFQSPWDVLLPVVLLAAAVPIAVAGTRRFRRGVKSPNHPRQTRWVVEGFRGWFIALSLVAFAGGLYTHTTWPLIVGAIFLGEELLETGIMTLALRSQEAREEDPAEGEAPAAGDRS